VTVSFRYFHPRALTFKLLEVFGLNYSSGFYIADREEIELWSVPANGTFCGTVRAPVQTGPGAYPASCTMGTGFLSRK